MLAQRLVIATDSDTPAGYVTAYDANLRSGTVWLAVASTERRQSGQMMAGVGLFLTELFSQYPIRRCLAECAAENLGFYESVIAEGTFEVEGTLVDHHRRPDGTFSDVSLLAVGRDHWMETWGRFVLRHVERHDDERNIDELRGLRHVELEVMLGAGRSPASRSPRDQGSGTSSGSTPSTPYGSSCGADRRPRGTRGAHPGAVHSW